MLSQVYSVSEVNNLKGGYVAPDNIFNECFDTILLEGKPVKCCQAANTNSQDQQIQKKCKLNHIQQQNDENQVLDEDTIIQFFESDLGILQSTENLNGLLSEQQKGVKEVGTSSIEQLFPLEVCPPKCDVLTPTIIYPIQYPPSPSPTQVLPEQNTVEKEEEEEDEGEGEEEEQGIGVGMGGAFGSLGVGVDIGFHKNECQCELCEKLEIAQKIYERNKKLFQSWQQTWKECQIMHRNQMIVLQHMHQGEQARSLSE